MDRSLVDSIKERVSVVDIVGRYVRLTPGGKSLKGLCPFHGEKSPSFYVSPDRGTWKCFGCGKGGDVIAFVQEMEKIEFREALVSLAEIAGIEIKQGFTNTSQGSTDETTQMYAVLNEASAMYRRTLTAHGAVQTYLRERGVTADSIASFGIGFAGDSWQGVSRDLEQRYGRELCLASGISLQGKSGIYDRFRSRIMFPTYDVRDRVITFSGRLWSSDGTFVTERDTSGKYINGPETAIYKKSKTLYGIHLARNACVRKQRVILVEGHLDCVMAHQAGFAETVAVAGTAMTSDHALLLRRYCDHAILCFDGDNAGQKATARTLPILYAAGFTVNVARIGLGKDPADMIRENPDAFARSIESATDYIDSRISYLQAHHVDLREAKRIFTDEVYPLLHYIVSPLVLDAALQKISQYLGVSVDSVREHVVQERARTEHIAPASDSGAQSSNHSQKKVLSPAEQLLLSWIMVEAENPNITQSIVTYLCDTVGMSVGSAVDFASYHNLEYSDYQLSYEWLYGGLRPTEQLSIDINRYAKKYIADKIQEATYAMNNAPPDQKSIHEQTIINLTERSQSIQKKPYA